MGKINRPSRIVWSSELQIRYQTRRSCDVENQKIGRYDGEHSSREVGQSREHGMRCSKERDRRQETGDRRQGERERERERGSVGEVGGGTKSPAVSRSK